MGSWECGEEETGKEKERRRVKGTGAQPRCSNVNKAR